MYRLAVVGVCVLWLACAAYDSPSAPQSTVTPSPAPAPAPAPTAPPTPAPIPSPVTEMFNDSIKYGDSACASVGVWDGRACRQYSFTITVPGSLEALLTSHGETDLDLELWRGSTRLDVSNSDAGDNIEGINRSLSAGVYEVRVVCFYGSTIDPTEYTLRITHPQ